MCVLSGIESRLVGDVHKLTLTLYALGHNFGSNKKKKNSFALTKFRTNTYPQHTGNKPIQNSNIKKT